MPGVVDTDPPYFSTSVDSTRRFWVRDEELDGRLDVRSGGFERAAPDYRIERDGFPLPLIEAVVGGAGTLELAGRRHRLAPGILFACGPGVPVRVVTDPRAVLRKYFLVVGGRDAAGLLAAARLAPGAVVRVPDPAAISDICEQAVRWGQGNAAGRARACATVVEYLCLRLARDAQPAGSDSAALATWRRCHALIEERFLELPSLAAVAVRGGIEPSHLCKLYRRFATETPYQHLRRLRLHHALSRLHAGASVATVAAEVGFSDPAHFSRAFAQVFGLPPSRVR
jgi:AraC-like DNA-binding protein